MKRRSVYLGLLLVLESSVLPLQADLSSILAPVSLPEPEPIELEMAEPAEKEELATPEVVEILVEKPILKRTAQTVITIDDVLVLLQALLTEKYAVEGDLRVFPLRSWADVKVDSASWHVDIVSYPMGGLSSTVVIRFRLFAGGELEGEWQLPIRCEIWEDVYHVKRQLKRGAPCAAEDIEVKSANTLKHNGEYVTASEDISIYELSQTVPSGRPLTWRNIVVRPVVRKGKIVHVLAEDGLMSISMKGQALENGIDGDFIAVKNLQSKKEIQAQIIDEKTVRVHF